MSREEFLEKIKELNEERFKLKRDYISEHAPYPINSIVKVIDNQTGKLLFKGAITTYFLSTINGHIDVAIHKITKKGKICFNIREYYNLDDSTISIIKED